MQLEVTLLDGSTFKLKAVSEEDGKKRINKWCDDQMIVTPLGHKALMTCVPWTAVATIQFVE